MEAESMIPTHSEQIVARTIKEFCRAYGVGKSTAYELMAAGVLDARKAGKRTLITEASARAWFESLSTKSLHSCVYK